MRILKTTTARGGNLSVRVIPVYSNQLIGQFLPIVDRRKSLLYSAVYNREVMIYQKIVTLFCQNQYQIYSSKNHSFVTFSIILRRNYLLKLENTKDIKKPSLKISTGTSVVFGLVTLSSGKIGYGVLPLKL